MWVPVLLIVIQWLVVFLFFVIAGEFKAFYFAVSFGIEGMLLVWMLAASFSACAGCYPLDTECAPGMLGAVLSACLQVLKQWLWPVYSQESEGRVWLISNLIVS